MKAILSIGFIFRVIKSLSKFRPWNVCSGAMVVNAGHVPAFTASFAASFGTSAIVLRCSWTNVKRRGCADMSVVREVVSFTSFENVTFAFSSTIQWLGNDKEHHSMVTIVGE